MNFKFPKHHFGKTKVVNRSFQYQWFEKWCWIHYDESHDLAFFHTHIMVMKTGILETLTQCSFSVGIVTGKMPAGRRGL